MKLTVNDLKASSRKSNQFKPLCFKFWCAIQADKKIFDLNEILWKYYIFKIGQKQAINSDGICNLMNWNMHLSLIKKIDFWTRVFLIVYHYEFITSENCSNL